MKSSIRKTKKLKCKREPDDYTILTDDDDYFNLECFLYQGTETLIVLDKKDLTEILKFCTLALADREGAAEVTRKIMDILREDSSI